MSSEGSDRTLNEQTSVRPHIYEYVRNGKIWINPDTDEPLTHCPFLEVIPGPNNSPGGEKYSCGIYLDRPEDCRLYPSSISEMIRDECEMIEAIDLKDPRRAELKLDALMSDSR